jgi:uncharacterized protein (TIGR02246 family)
VAALASPALAKAPAGAKAPAAASGNEKEETALKAVAAQMDQAWNTHNSGAYAANFSENGTILISMGLFMKGRADIQAKLGRFFLTALKMSKEKITLKSYHFIRPDLVTIDGEILVEGYKSFRDSLRNMSLHLTVVATKQKGKWVVEDTRCYYAVGTTPAPAPPEQQPPDEQQQQPGGAAAGGGKTPPAEPGTHP